MTSCGPDIQSRDFSHMYSFVDYRSNAKPELCFIEGTIYDYLRRNPEYSRMKQIVDRSMLADRLNNEQANFTLFITPDKYLTHVPKEFFDDMDVGDAYNIVKASLIIRKITKEWLTSSPVCYLYTENPAMRMYVTNISGVTHINNCAKVVHYDVLRSNGLIHIIDNLIVPTMDTFMN